MATHRALASETAIGLRAARLRQLADQGTSPEDAARALLAATAGHLLDTGATDDDVRRLLDLALAATRAARRGAA